MDNYFLHGAQAIADFLGTTPRKVYHLHETGAIPVAKLGAVLTARRSRLIEHFEVGERETLARSRDGSERAA